MIIDLHNSYLKLSVDKFREALGCTIIDCKFVFRRRLIDRRLSETAFGSKIFFEKDEIVFIADIAIFIEVDLTKKQLIDIVWAMNADSVE